MRARRVCLAWLTLAVAGLSATAAAGEHTVPLSSNKSADLYQSACAACHGADGRGAAPASIGSRMRVPDFTDCAFTTSEPDTDWLATIHLGGRARALDRAMPAFGDALSDDDIRLLVGFVRGFCANRAWPSGNLNPPRPLMTDKAFPENEAFVVTEVPATDTNRVDTHFVYERRIGARSQIEVVVPFNAVDWPGGWNHGLGDVAAQFKRVVFASERSGTIVSGSAGMTFPTGKETEGLGGRLTVFEPSVSAGQLLRGQAFIHAQAGIAIPLNISTAPNEVYWRTAFAKTFTQGRWNRSWSPMLEVTGKHQLAFDEPTFWDIAPELHVTLSRRQHVALSGGVRLPLNGGPRSPIVMASLLWDWYQGGLFAGW